MRVEKNNDVETTRVDRNFDERWNQVMLEFERHKQRTGTLPHAAAEAMQAIRAALAFENRSVTATTTAKEMNNNNDTAAAATTPSETPNESHTTTTTNAAGVATASSPSTPVPHPKEQSISIREDDDDSSEDEKEEDTKNIMVENDGDVAVANDESPQPMDTDNDSEDDDEEEEDVPEFSNDAPIEQVWYLHEQVGWYKKRIDAQESHYMNPRGGDVYTSLDDFVERHVRVQYPDWTGPTAALVVATPQPPPNARQQRVVTATQTKPVRPMRRRTAPVNLLRAAPAPFPWHTQPELLQDAAIIEILQTLGVQVIKKQKQYVLPGTSSKHHAFRSLRGVQQYLYDHGLPRAATTSTTKPILCKLSSSNLALWISCAPIQDDPELLEDLQTSEPLKKDEQLHLRLQRVHGFFAEGERLYVPDYRAIPRADESWEEGKHYYHATVDLHTRVRALVRNNAALLQNDPQLRRWCYTNHGVPPEPSAAAMTDEVLGEYTSILPLDTGSSSSCCPDSDLEFKSDTEEKMSTTKEPKATEKKSVKHKTPSKAKHWWEKHSFPGFTKEIQPLLLKMGCTQQKGQKWILPWWPRQAFSVASVAAMCRVHVSEDAASNLTGTEQEILRRWAMFSILGSETSALHAISSPVKSTAGMAELFRSAGWLAEPERLYVPGYQDIDRPSMDYIYGSHFFWRDCNGVYKPSEERKIRAYIRQHPKAAGESSELLKWAANDSTADLSVAKEPTIDQMLQLLEISLREGSTELGHAATTSTFSMHDVVNSAEQEPAWYLTTKRPEWSEDVKPLSQDIGISRSKGAYVHGQVPTISWREPEDVAKYFLEHGVPDFALLDDEDAQTVERWIRFCYVPNQSMHQMKLADRLLHVTPFEKLFDKAGASELVEKLLSEHEEDTEQLRLRICATEILGCSDNADESHRRVRRGKQQCHMASKEKDLYTLALRLWAASSTAPLPLLKTDLAVRSPTASLAAECGSVGADETDEQNGEPMSTETGEESADVHHECNEDEQPEATTDGDPAPLAECTQPDEVSEPGLLPSVAAVLHLEGGAPNSPCNAQPRVLLSDQSNTPRTENKAAPLFVQDVEMKESTEHAELQNQADCLKRPLKDSAIAETAGGKKHKRSSASCDSATIQSLLADNSMADCPNLDFPMLMTQADDCSASDPCTQENEFGLDGFHSPIETKGGTHSQEAGSNLLSVFENLPKPEP